MRHEKLPYNETIIIYNGIPYILERVTDLLPGDTADVCSYCDLRTMCKQEDGSPKFLALCMPNQIGINCCFHIDYEYCGCKIGDFIP